MRIIAGQHKGRKLLGPAGKGTTRPITDRVKTSLFDRLTADGLIEGAVVLDLFCGTGSMGLECLSRGAKRVTFVDRDRVARARLEKNLEAIGKRGDATVLSGDILSAGLVGVLPDGPYDLIFVDPPYPMMADGKSGAKVMAQLERLAGAAAAGAVLEMRTERHVAVGAVAGWGEPDSHRYGTMVLHFFGRGG